MGGADPFVSVILPCRNEEAYIERTLEQILSQEMPEGGVEVLVVDGESEDRTCEIVRRYAEEDPRIRLLDNSNRMPANALNIGIGEARGSYIVRMDAHSAYPSDYIRTLVDHSERSGAENVGGTWDIRPGGDGIWARTVAAVTAHPFGVGNVPYRLAKGDPVEVDTVPYGCFKKELFDRIGAFDTEAAYNEDNEFNARIILNGGRVLLIPGIRIAYYGRSTLRGMARQYYRYALYKPFINRKLERSTTLRQFAPPIFVLLLVGILAVAIFYPPAFWVLAGGGILYLFASWKLAYDKRELVGIRGGLTVPVALFVLHISYGSAYLKGLFRRRRKKG